MTVTIDTSDLYHFADEMAAAGGKIGSGAAQVMRDASHAAEEYQRTHMERHRRTGATINSVGTDFTGDGRYAEMIAEVGVTTDHWRFIEYGTVDIEPDPIIASSGDAADTVLVLGLDDVLKDIG